MLNAEKFRPRIEYVPTRLTAGKVWFISFYAYDPDMANAGVPLNVVQGQADHHSLEMTSVYMHRQHQANARIKEISTF